MFDKRKLQIDKRNAICEHCKKKDNNEDTCFKTNGVPEWLKKLSDKRPSQTVQAMIIDGTSQASTTQSFGSEKIKSFIREGLQRMMGNFAVVPDSPVDFSNAVIHYAGNTVENKITCSIIDKNS